MIPSRRIFAAMIFAVSVLATPAFAALFPSPIEQANRAATSRMWANARDRLAEQITKFNEEITAARAQYWATYPDKPGAAAAAERFAGLLREKDIYFLNVGLESGNFGITDVGVRMDGEIRRSASFEFKAWVERVKLFTGTLLSSRADPIAWMERLQHAPEMAPWEYKRYALERSWWEFDHVGRIPAQFDKPETYGRYLYYRFAFLWIEKDDPRSEQPEENADATYAKFVEVMGKQVVYDAARKVMNAPKTESGNLVVTAKRPVKVGPSGVVTQQVSVVEQVITALNSPRNFATTRETPEVEDPTVPVPDEVIGVFSNPLVALERLVTKEDDRRYLLWLLSPHYLLKSTTITGRKTQWEAAEILYRRLVLAFGEKDVLEVSRVVRTATKRLTDGEVMDPKAIGAARGEPLYAFEDILARKQPRGYLRAALIAREPLETPAAVDAAYRKLALENREEALVETARMRAAKPGRGIPNLTSARELESVLEWLRHPPVEAPVGPLADSPGYLEWKGFTAGAKVSYTERVWQRGRMGDQLVAGGPTYRYAYQLQWINDESAKLWFTEINYSNYGQARPGHDSELSYPAKFNLPLDGSTYSSPSANERSLQPMIGEPVVWPSAAPIESGEEILEIAGRKIATRWQSVSHTHKPDSWDKDVKLTVKVWTSDAVPRGLVRRIEDRVFPPQHYRYPLGARFVKETYLDAFEGNRAGVAPPNPALPVAAPYAPSPSGPSAPAPETKGLQISSAARVGTIPAPASAPAPIPAQPQRTVAAASLPPAVAAQVEFSQRLSKLVTRANRAKSELARMERALAGQGLKPPNDVYTARDGIDPLIKDVTLTAVRNPAASAPKLETLDETVSVIEKYLKLK